MTTENKQEAIERIKRKDNFALGSITISLFGMLIFTLLTQYNVINLKISTELFFVSTYILIFIFGIVVYLKK